jgi:hypothetical protein
MDRCNGCDDYLRPYDRNGCKSCFVKWCASCGWNKITAFTYGERNVCTLCFKPPEGKYKCTKCSPGACVSTGCWIIGLNYRKDTTVYRGLCCRARQRTLCKGCVKWELKKACITLIGIRKYRRGNLLNSLPRDVLIYALLKPYWIEKTQKRNDHIYLNWYEIKRYLKK